MGHVFVSYSSKDRPFVRRLVDDLRAAGADIWLDVDAIVGAKPYWDEIQQAVETCSHFLFVASPDTIEPECGAMDELYHAKQLRPTPRFVVVVAREIDYEKMPIILSPGRYQYHDFSQNPYEVMLPKVMKALGIAETPLAKATFKTEKTTPTSAPSAAGEMLMELRGHKGWVITACFSLDGQQILTASYDQTARLWDAHSGQLLNIFKGHHGEVNSAVFDPTSTQIVTGSFDGTAKVWSLSKGYQLLQTITHPARVYHANYGYMGYFATASADGTLKIWETQTGRLALSIITGMENDCVSSYGSVATGLIAAAGQSKVGLIYDSGTGDQVQALIGHEKNLLGIRFSPDGQTIATTSYDETARVWDVKTGRELMCYKGHREWVRRANFSPNIKLLATASKDGTARIWEVATGKQLREIPFIPGVMVADANFSPDGNKLVMACGDMAQIWDISDLATQYAEH